MKKVGNFMWKALLDIIKSAVRWFNYKNRLEGKVDMMMRRLIRLEITEAIKRKDTQTVLMLFDEYKALNGNSYITLLVENFLKTNKKKKKK